MSRHYLDTFYFVEVQDVAMIAIHTDPDKADEEIDALIPVHDIVKSRWKIGQYFIFSNSK